MKKEILVLALLFVSFANARSTSEKPLNLRCQSVYKEPIFYRASLQGPNKNNFHKLQFSYRFEGQNLNYQYNLKKIQKSFIGQKARVYKLKVQNNKRIRLYVETDKAGPIDMICK
jgi:hypothetical protein